MTAITGASAMSVVAANSAHAAPGDKPAPNTYVPVAEKGSPSGVASLDANAKILPAQLPDFSATIVTEGSKFFPTKSGENLFSGRQQVIRQALALPVGVSTHRAFDATLENRNTEATATPTTIVTQAVRARIQHGSASVNARGSNLGVASIVDVIGTADNGNEHGAFFGVVRMGSSIKPANGKVWVADLGAHSPLGGVQPQLLTGVTLFLNNYYNGRPVEGPSVGFAAVTKRGSGPAASGAGHDLAETYPNDIGVAVVGKSRAGGVDAPGWRKGVQVGGYASGWMAEGESSMLETGIEIRDYTVQGLYVHSPHGSVPTAAAARFGGNVDLNNGAQIRGYKPDGITKSLVASINSSGQAVFGQNGTPTVAAGTSIEMQTAGGTMLTLGSSSVTVGDGKALSFGTTAGTMIGATTIQKLAFYGTTPIARPSGTPNAATDAASTQALVNDLRSKLMTLGLIG
ncbi:hypothetical protein [Arthrobacter sp. B6]|uniref:hypothetical protein n=1 Tax=Arthrobacter sp. B6 TaxID=1570137 RepID=UPI0012E8267A|nr:hypothetical protein [Arthrobacter sp. B6]